MTNSQRISNAYTSWDTAFFWYQEKTTVKMNCSFSKLPLMLWMSTMVT